MNDAEARMKNCIREIFTFYNRMDYGIRQQTGIISSLFFSVVLLTVKLLIGIIFGSLLFLYSCIYAACIAVCRIILLRDFTKKRESQRRACLITAGILCVTAFIFNMFLLLQLIYQKRVVRYSPLVVSLFGICLLLQYGMTVRGMLLAKKEKSISGMGLRIVSFSSFLMNLVLFQRMLLGCLSISDHTVETVNFSFGISCGIGMFLSAAAFLFYIGKRE